MGLQVQRELIRTVMATGEGLPRQPEAIGQIGRVRGANIPLQCCRCSEGAATQHIVALVVTAPGDVAHFFTGASLCYCATTRTSERHGVLPWFWGLPLVTISLIGCFVGRLHFGAFDFDLQLQRRLIALLPDGMHHPGDHPISIVDHRFEPNHFRM